MTDQQRKTMRQLREERGLTQFDLAVKAEASLSSVVNIEAGRQEPRVSLAEKLASALGVSVADIIWPSVDDLAKKRPKEMPAA